MYNIYLYFLIIILISIIYTSLVKNNTSFLINNKYIINSKYNQLNGLRGILAISVIFHHSIIMYNYYIHGRWEIPQSDFYTLLGQISVSLFFIITGFLFGFKIFNNKFKIKQFVVSRIIRIIPLQILSVFIVFLVIFTIDNFALKTNINDLVYSFISWITYSVKLINQNHNSFVIETVYWTLVYEWKFYLFLPILFFIKNKFIKNKYLFLLFLSVIAIIDSKVYIALFVFGIITSFLIINKIKINSKLIDLIGFLSLLFLFIFFETAYNLYACLLLFLLFLSIIYGNIFKVILNIKILNYFGHISYSMYLLHNIIIFVLFYLIDNYYKSIINISNYEYWVIVFLIINFTLIISFQTYKYVEYRFYYKYKKKENK
jgi:peptidoglycan/LPS O-acetylase OafA/YrhL